MSIVYVIILLKHESQITLHAAANHLVAHEASEVAIIDTTGSFSPIRLLDVICLRLRGSLGLQVHYQHSGYVYSKARVGVNADVERSFRERATGMLDRVKVMRVFDFAGVIEAIGEVCTLCEESEKIGSAQTRPERNGRVEANRIASSQDEGKVGIEDAESSTTQISRSTPGNEGIGMIIIDNIASPLGSIMSQNQTHAQALLTTSFRSLRHLTTTYNICTIVINAAVGLASLQYPRHGEDGVSVFATTKGKPALGKTYAYLVDTSIFLSQVPKTREDAEVAHGQGRRDKGRWSTVGIFEVLKDCRGTREGEWGAFDIEKGLELRAYEG